MEYGSVVCGHTCCGSLNENGPQRPIHVCLNAWSLLELFRRIRWGLVGEGMSLWVSF